MSNWVWSLTIFVALAAVPALAQETSTANTAKCPKCGHEFAPLRVAPTGMVVVPAGNFMMGCNEKVDKECKDAESPYREVFLDSYFIDRTETTVADYNKCVDAGGCTPPKTTDKSKYCNFCQEAKAAHPVNCIEWLQAKTYCEWAGKRLPTEAEWEKAARGSDGRKHPWGNEAATCEDAVLNLDGGEGCGKGGTWPTCSLEKGNGPYGNCDMVGNVWEWVADWYLANYYGQSPNVNPAGPLKGTQRVLRGGSFTSKLSESSRVSNRFYFKADIGLGNFGFRCAK